MFITRRVFREGIKALRFIQLSTRYLTASGTADKRKAMNDDVLSIGEKLSKQLNSRDDFLTKSKFTVCVEGNIGSGKTTLLEYFQNSDTTEVYQEPVTKWRNIQGHNALGLMYKDPSRWGLTFQTYVQLTMLQVHTHPQVKPLKMIERSLYSAKYCFVENLHRSGLMPDVEYIVLTEWFDWLVKTQDIKIDLIVYLQTRPETVFERIKRRHRKEEHGIPLDYLQTLHELHEDWLIHQKFPCNSEVLVLDGNKSLEEMFQIYEDNKPTIMKGV